jgi:hypothetical protein
VYGHNVTHAGFLASAGGATLPFTGISLTWVLALAVVLLVVGVLLARLVPSKGQR